MELRFTNDAPELTVSELDSIRQLLAFRSVSADPERSRDVRAAAEWLRERCVTLGLEHAELLETEGHPCVYADWLHADGRPTVLLYGHFDVQPVSDPSAWSTDPFDPVVLDGCIHARGAADMKCQLWAGLAAVGDLLRLDGVLPLNVRVLFEGEEESLSPNLRPVLAARSDQLACDFAVTPDGAQPREGRPRVGIGSRGFCELEVEVRTNETDLHSGTYGGAVRNAAHVMAKLLSTLHDDQGRVNVDGFYDGVAAMSREDRAFLRGELDPPLPRSYGSLGEPDWSPWERTTLRPSLDVNGVRSGYAGEGPMTVIPAAAHAKLSCRLVPDQDPLRVRAMVERHLRDHAPAGATLVVAGSAASPAFRCPPQHPVVQAASAVLREMTGQDPVLALLGGTLPVQAFLRAELGAYMITFGFSGEDEGIHSVNEFHRLESIRRARFAYRALLPRLAEAPPLSLTESVSC
jgi:acetylornithine deacetylase/succinyl-diaminopimelate desuccinylase-like protein